MKLKYALVGFLIAGVAFAAAEVLGGVDFFAETRPIQFIKGVYIGPRVGPNRPTLDTTSKITGSYGKFTSWDFPAITNVQWQTIGGTIDGPTVALPGARMGDVCFAVSDHTVWDGGKPMYFEPICEVPANDFVLLRGRAISNDAGVTIDPVDAGYFLRIFGPSTSR